MPNTLAKDTVRLETVSRYTHVHADTAAVAPPGLLDCWSVEHFPLT